VVLSLGQFHTEWSLAVYGVILAVIIGEREAVLRASRV
jgi:hypothetical protein